MKIKKIIGLFITMTIIVLPAFGQKKQPEKIKVFKTVSGWKKIKLDGFSFIIPAEMNLSNDKGIDSPFWSFSDEKNMLDVSIGQYVGFQSGLRSELEYQEEKIKIVKTDALICFYTLDEQIEDYKFVSRVFLLKKDGAKFSVSMTLYHKNQNEKDIARKIFHSIKFR